jgi:fluoride exporter
VPEPTALPADSNSGSTRELIDADVDLRLPSHRAELRRAPWAVLGVISAGGALGALGRYGLSVAYPVAPNAFPWTTFAVNVSGCLLIGVLMVLVTDVWAGHRLIRPFLGVGVLGGYTTFSTYVVDIQRLVDHRAAATALAYLAGTLVAAVLATYGGTAVTRWALTLGRKEVR